MTPEQAEKIRDAVIMCRQTSRTLMMAGGPASQDAIDADDAAFAEVNRLITEATA